MMRIVRWMVTVIPGTFKFVRRCSAACVFKPEIAILGFYRQLLEVLCEVLISAAHPIRHPSISGKDICAGRHLGHKEVDIF